MKVKSAKKPQKRKKIDSPFARNLSAVLAERGLSIRAAAEICEVPASVLHSWANGAKPYDLLAVQKLCRATKTNFEWLLTGSTSSVEAKDLSLTEIFEEKETGFAGIFKIEAKRLVRRGGENNE